MTNLPPLLDIEQERKWHQKRSKTLVVSCLKSLIADWIGSLPHFALTSYIAPGYKEFTSFRDADSPRSILSALHHKNLLLRNT